jgi:hypothetical protein
MIATIGRYLDPETVFAELLFGLIMALTFTLGASLVVGTDTDRSREIIYGVVACNLAWGLIDGVFHVLGELFELGRRGMLIKRVQTPRSREEAMLGIREEFDERIAAITTPEERERIYGTIHQLVMRMAVPETRPTREGLLGALLVFALVSATSLPVLLPALVLEDPGAALKIANVLLVACLFLTGRAMAKAAGGHGNRFGLIMAAVGLVLVGIAKALGG